MLGRSVEIMSMAWHHVARMLCVLMELATCSLDMCRVLACDVVAEL